MSTYSIISKENDNTYLNISFISNLTSNAQSLPLEYNVNKTRPIVDKASDYYITVVKFDIPLQAIPLTIMPIIPNQANPNLSTLIVGIRNGGANFVQNVIYVPQNSFPVPEQNDVRQVITPYYYIYSYDQMISMINTALTAAFLAAFGTTVEAPYFVYNPVTQLFSLIVTAAFNAPGGPQVICNYLLFQFLDNFDVTVVPSFNNTVNDLFAFVVNGIVNESFGYVPFGQNPPAPIPFPGMTPPNNFKITQGSRSVQTWSPIRKILFSTTTIPINPENTPPVNINQNNTGVSNSQSILTDFTPQIENAGDSRTTAFYNPSGIGNFRLVDLISDSPIYKIDIKVFWQDIDNNIYNLLIPAFQQANIKLGFIRKTLYKNYK